MTNWNIIKEWALLDREIKLEVTLAVIIVSMGFVIIHYERKLTKKDEDAAVAQSESDAETRKCYQDHIKYVEASEKQFKEIALDIKKLKDSL